MRRIDAKYFQFLAKEGQLLQRAGERRLVRMRLDIGQKLGGGELPSDHVAFKLGHVDAIGSKTAERLIERHRHVAHPENKARYDRSGAKLRPLRDFRQHDETRRVMRFVLDVGGEHVEAVDVRREARGDRRTAAIAPLRDFPRGPGGIAGDMRGEAMRADNLPALAERMNMAIDRSNLLEFRALTPSN